MAVLDAEIKQRALSARETLARFGTVRAMYVFGSQVNGMADEWSDIDLAVFMDGIEEWDLFQHARAMSEVQREAGNDVEAHLFPDSLRQHPQRATFSDYILKHGVRIDEPEAQAE